MLIHGKCILIVEDILFILAVDSDSDNFQSLKKASKQNGKAKPTKSDAASARPAAKEVVKSPSSTQGKTVVKSPPVPVTPKSAPPPQPKHTPTSVLDYFGSATIQRSDKKLVASTKRKTVSVFLFKPSNSSCSSSTLSRSWFSVSPFTEPLSFFPAFHYSVTSFCNKLPL